jgi:hypothetical protein
MGWAEGEEQEPYVSTSAATWRDVPYLMSLKEVEER